MNNSQPRRVRCGLIGLGIAAVLPVLLFIIVELFDYAAFPYVFAFGPLLFLVYSAPIFFLGWPIYFLFYQRMTLLLSCLVAVAITIVPFIFIMTMTMAYNGPLGLMGFFHELDIYILFVGLSGVFSGMIFWCIVNSWPQKYQNID